MNSLVISLINCRYSKFLCTFPLNSFIDELSRANMSVQLNQQTQSQGFQEVHYLSGTCKSAQKLQGKTSTNGRLLHFMASHLDESWLPFWSVPLPTFKGHITQILALQTLAGVVPFSWKDSTRTPTPASLLHHSPRQSCGLLLGFTQIYLLTFLSFSITYHYLNIIFIAALFASHTRKSEPHEGKVYCCTQYLVAYEGMK